MSVTHGFWADPTEPAAKRSANRTILVFQEYILTLRHHKNNITYSGIDI